MNLSCADLVFQITTAFPNFIANNTNGVDLVKILAESRTRNANLLVRSQSKGRLLRMSHNISLRWISKSLSNTDSFYTELIFLFMRNVAGSEMWWNVEQFCIFKFTGRTTSPTHQKK